MQKINKIILSVGVLSLAVALSASAQYATPTRPELRADMRDEVRSDVIDFKKERSLGIEQMRGEVKDIREAARAAIASGTVPTGTTTRKETINQIKGARKEFADDRREDVKELRGDIKDEVKDMRDKMHDMMPDNSLKTRLMATATIEALAAKLNVSTSSILDRVASGTKLKEIIGDKIDRSEIAKILHPIVYERAASSSDKLVPRFLSKIFGERKEIVTDSIDENGEVVQEVKSNVGFLRRLFNF
jgi:hypothetical protein